MATDFTKSSLRFAAAVVVAGGLSACSTMESLDPTGLLGGDSASSDTSGIPSDGTEATADSTSADTSQPDVASIPDRPQAPSSDADNAQTASSLQADAANVQYSAESLRGGTEASAPPPAAGDGQPTQVAEASPPPAQTPDQADAGNVPADNITPGTQGAADAGSETPAQPAAAPAPSDAPLTEAPAQPAAAPPPSETPDNAAVPEPAPVPEQSDTAEAPSQPAAAPPEEPATPGQPAAAASPDAAPAPTQVASAGPVPGAQAPVTRRAAPGFAPSTAPALDPSVSQFVAKPIIARYKQTAMLKPSVFPDYSAAPATFGPATATIMFPGDTTILDDKGLQQVRAAAELYKSRGGNGYVRVVGYASASSGNLPASRLMQINFDHSQARAIAIARALMKAGVPASKVLVDAAPQTASVAKAEIFVQG
ncbi:MAG TPA: OmpA family protein [Rhizomicrobium sp.]|nr:OmpA family protein [Rhizomicrobium sp.]